MAPPRMIAKEQQEILVDFLEANKDMSKGLNRCAPMTHITMRQKWSVLAKKLNAVESGIMKAPDGWKRYWFEWRFKCKKKAKKAMLHQANPNKSRSRHVSLNNLEIRVLELSGDASVNVTIYNKLRHGVVSVVYLYAGRFRGWTRYYKCRVFSGFPSLRNNVEDYL